MKLWLAIKAVECKNIKKYQFRMSNLFSEEKVSLTTFEML